MIQRWVCDYKNISSTQRAQANQLVESLKQQVQDDVKKSLQPSHVDSVVVTTAAVTATSTNTSKDAVIWVNIDRPAARGVGWVVNDVRVYVHVRVWSAFVCEEVSF